jgi:large subunit ribosomal protein L15
MADPDKEPEAASRSRARSKASAPESAAPEKTAPGSTARGSTARGSTARGSTARGSTARGKTAPGNTDGAAADGAGRARLKLHHLRPAPGAHRDKTRVGRGEASKGKTAGRGTKGTRARGTVPARFEGGQMPIHRRLPKLKGFSNHGFKTTYQVVNLDRLTALYPSGGDVTPDDLVAKGAVRKGKLVKILGTGEAGSKLRVTAHAFSGSAREKITAAGGSATEL